MKLLGPLLVAFAALLSTVMALDISASITPSDSAELVSWPKDAAAFRLRRRTGLTNAQRIQRGLTPSRPRQLYQGKVDSGLAKRFDDPALQAKGSASPNTYNFDNCQINVVAGRGFAQYSIAYTDAQDLANKCAKLQDNLSSTPGAYLSFFIVERTTSNCLVSAGSGGDPVSCTAGDTSGAIYRLAP